MNSQYMISTLKRLAILVVTTLVNVAGNVTDKFNLSK